MEQLDESAEMASLQEVRRLASLVQGSEFLVVPGGSHRPHMIRENPLFVNDAILRFLANCNT